jgi:hypothetical protein
MLYALAALSSPALAQDVVLTPEADSTIERNPSVVRGWSLSPDLFVGFPNNRRRHTVVRYDFSPVAPSATVTSASLVMDVATFTGTNPLDVTLHVLDSSWVEGTESAGDPNGSTSPTGVTWFERDATNGISWGTSGGDFGPAVASATVTGTGEVTFALPAVLVDDLASGVVPNNGFIVRADGSRATIRSKDHPTAAPGFRLELVLDGPTDNLDAVVEDMAVGVNALMPGFIDEAAAGRRRPSTIVRELRDAVMALEDAGCVVDTTFENFSFGTYGLAGISGSHVTGSETGAMSGMITRSPKGVSGTFTDAGGAGVDHTFGDNFSGYADLRLAADYQGASSGYTFGLAIRDSGLNGAFVAIHDVCDGAGSFEAALNDWAETPIFPVP